MELGLSLGDGAASKSFGFIENQKSHSHEVSSSNKGLGFCMGLSIGPSVVREDANDHHQDEDKQITTPTADGIQLIHDLLPNTPVGAPWQMARWFDVNKFPLVEDQSPPTELDGASSPKSNNSAASSFQMDFCIYSNTSGGKRDLETETASDEDENGSTRKKLRLSKQQSAFLEESFKEHNTLNPKQKLVLAKQLNLRPRQVEVWFQNRRARTKLKQTEVDCGYLKRCCETLTQENRRLQKELQELRALKTNSNPFCKQLPATTLNMCPSCERVATNTTSKARASTGLSRSITTKPSPSRLFPTAEEKIVKKF